MKRSILAVAAVLALGSASAFAQTAGVLPSFNDAPDIDAPNMAATISTTDNAKSSASARASDAQYAQSSHAAGATRSDASSGAGSDTSSDRGFGAGSQAHEPAETLNDTFHYPTSD
jgi:hypothetical protein